MCDGSRNRDEMETKRKGGMRESEADAASDVFDVQRGMQGGKSLQLKGRRWRMRGCLIRALRAAGINRNSKARTKG